MANSTHTCAICLEELVIPCPNMCMTECSHIFHLNCLLMSREHNDKCPLCRADILSQRQNDNVQIIEENNIIEEDIIENIDNVLIIIDNGMQLSTSITNIVNNASNNNISDMLVHERQIYIDQISNLCTNYVESMFNYLTAFRYDYNINHVNYHNVNLRHYTDMYNMNEKISEMVERASINNIRNNITFYRMENDIHDLCHRFGEYLIMNLHA